MHPRAKIRHKIFDLLLNKTKAGDQVFRTRVQPIRKLKLPSISIYTSSESVDPDGLQSAPRENLRNISLTIEGWVKVDTTYPDRSVDDQMDDLALEIEHIVLADPQLGGIASDLFLESTDTEVIEIGDRLMGLIILTFDVEYCTLASVPIQTALDDLKTVDSITNLGGTVDPGDRVEDLIVLGL